MTGDKLKLMKSYGRCVRPAAGKDKGEWTTVCQGCGKKISSADPDEGIEFSFTRLKSAYFFHTRCFAKAVCGPIKWENTGTY